MSDITIDQLQIEIDAEAKRATEAITKLQGQLDKLSSTMSNITQGTAYQNLECVTDSLRSISSIVIPIETANSIRELSNSVSRFGSANVEKALFNIPLLTSEITKMVQTMNGTTMSFDATSLSGLIDSVSKLGGVKSTSAAANIPFIAQGLKQLATELDGVSFNGDIAGLNQLSSAISKLGGKSATMATTNIPRLTIALNNMMKVLSKAPSVSGNLIGMTNAMANLSAQGQKVSTASGGIGRSLSGLSGKLGVAGIGFTTIAAAIGTVYANCWMLIRALKTLTKNIIKFVKSSMDFIETYNYFDAAFGQVAGAAEKNWEEAGYESAEAYIHSFESTAKELTQKMTGYILGEDGSLRSSGGVSLGMDPNMMLGFQAQFAQMSSSMGVASDYAVKLSNAMTMLGADLASVKNLEFADAYKDLTSGLAGMSRTMDQFGVNIRNVNLQQRLFDLGISTNITKLNQNDKALLRSIVILDSTRYAWSDLSDTLEQPANELRQLSANFQNLGRTIGNIFLGAVAKTLPYLNAFVIALQKLAQWIIDIFGIEIPSITSQSSGSISDFMDDMEDGFDGAAGSAKKLKQQLLGIDELNVISSKDNAGSGIGGSLEDTAAIQSAFDAIYDEYMQAWEEAYAKVENKAQQMANNLASIATVAATNIANGFNNVFDGDTSAVKDNIKGIVKTVTDIMKNPDLQKAGKNYLDSFYEAGGSAAGALADVGTDMAEGITDGINDSLEKNAPYITEKLTSIFDNLTSINETTISLSGAFAQIGDVFKGDNFKDLVETFTDFATVFQMEYWDTLTGVLSDLYNFEAQPIIRNVDGIKEALDKVFLLIDTMLEPVGKIIALVTGNSKSYEEGFIHKMLLDMTDMKSLLIGDMIDKINNSLDNSIKRAQFINSMIELMGKNIAFSIGRFEKIFTTIGTKVMSVAKTSFDFISAKFEALKTEFEPLAEWFNTNVLNKLLNGVNTVGNSIKDVFSGVWDDFVISGKDAANKVIGVFEELINNIINNINKMIDGMNDALKGTPNFMSLKTLSNVTIPKINVNGYALGGMPSVGEIFLARESGPELVGSMGNHSVVANNDQIVEGIQGGVERAVANILLPYLQQIASDTSECASKDYETSTNGLLRQVRNGARQFKKTTGNDAFVF